MATNTYVALQTITISGTSTNDVTITGIPQGYTDLVIVTNLNNIGNVAVLRGQFNGDTTTSYSSTALNGDGSSASSGRQSNVDAFYMTYQGHINSTKATGIYHIMNYSNSTTYKTVISRSSNASFGVDAVVSLWRKTDPITSIRIVNDRAEYWTAGSTINIYGIAANTDTSYTALATGGTITSDIGYIYHTFTSSGTFTPTSTINGAEILVVAGGGGGGPSGGGGGGAGGLLGFTGQTLTAGTSYTCTVGAGGAITTNGGNSQFGSLQLVYGGGRGGYNTAGNGGSGGGLQGGAAAGTGYAGPPRQGYNGADAGGVGYNGWPHGGGGGAGGNGYTPANNSVGGVGGPGSSAYSVWGAATSTGHNVSGVRWYAGGGGGGTYGTSGSNASGLSQSAGGNGGGGNGNSFSEGTAGMANTGGGGGGGRDAGSTIGGGSGIIIVRYPR